MEGTERCQECQERVSIDLIVVTVEEDGPTIYCKDCFNNIQIKYQTMNDYIIANNIDCPLFAVRPLVD
jgi:hypothetical protein